MRIHMLEPDSYEKFKKQQEFLREVLDIVIDIEDRGCRCDGYFRHGHTNDCVQPIVSGVYDNARKLDLI